MPPRKCPAPSDEQPEKTVPPPPPTTTTTKPAKKQKTEWGQFYEILHGSPFLTNPYLSGGNKYVNKAVELAASQYKKTLAQVEIRALQEAGLEVPEELFAVLEEEVSEASGEESSLDEEGAEELEALDAKDGARDKSDGEDEDDEDEGKEEEEDVDSDNNGGDDDDDDYDD